MLRTLEITSYRTFDPDMNLSVHVLCIIVNNNLYLALFIPISSVLLSQ
jgi:hypothetical protein